MVPTGRKLESTGPQIGHRVVGLLLVSQIPSDNGGIQIGFLPTLLVVLLPFVRQVGNHEALIVVDRRSSSRGRSPKKCRGHAVFVPSPLEFLKVFLRKQITGSLEHGIALLVDLFVLKGLGKDQTARPLPIFRRGPRYVREPIFGGSVETHNRGVRLKFVLVYQVDVLFRISIVLVKDKAVWLDGDSPIHVHLELGVITLVEKELAIRNVSFSTGLGQHVSQRRQELVSPHLDRVLVLFFVRRKFVADNVPVCPPNREVFFDVFSSAMCPLLFVVFFQCDTTLDFQSPTPGILVVSVGKGTENPHLAVSNHDVDPAFHVEKEILERVHHRDGRRRLVKRQIEAKIDGIHHFLGAGALENVARRVVGLPAVVLWNLGGPAGFLSGLGNRRDQDLLDLVPRDQGGEDVLQVRKSRIGSAVVPDVLPHEFETVILRFEPGDLVRKILHRLVPILRISVFAKDAAIFRGVLVFGEFRLAELGRIGCHCPFGSMVR
mmetsp:Transcript_6767/g.19574  ORF Transcript_6767/g.19574 Transcript_6767/m.19574 type:complete len:491 (+) Transcript_6767:1335-2807(+)